MNQDENYDWGELNSVSRSEEMWNHFKERIRLRMGLDGKPDLKEWAQKIYDQYVNPEDKVPCARPGVEYMTCQSAARERNPPAVKICIMLRWIHRQKQLEIGGQQDVISWLNSCK